MATLATHARMTTEDFDAVADFVRENAAADIAAGDWSEIVAGAHTLACDYAGFRQHDESQYMRRNTLARVAAAGLARGLGHALLLFAEHWAHRPGYLPTWRPTTNVPA